MEQKKLILRRARIGVLCGVFAVCQLLTVSCSSFKWAKESDPAAELKAEIQQTVADSVRADAMLKSVDHMVVTIDKLNVLLVDQQKQLNDLIQNYSTTRPALDAAMDDALKARQVLVDELAKAHYEFKAQATAKEWKKLSQDENTVLSTIFAQGAKGGV